MQKTWDGSENYGNHLVFLIWDIQIKFIPNLLEPMNINYVNYMLHLL